MKFNLPDYDLLAEYYSLHYEELRQFVGARIHFAYETEDIVQNIFVRLLNTDKMITPITLPCLVYTVARNMIYDYWRHKQRVDEWEHTLRHAPEGTDNSTESVYSIQEMNAFLERGIARLTKKEQRIYRMNLYEDKKVSDIATELQMNYKGVERHLGTARKQVRKYFLRMLA